jgi:hypothetical protein
MASAFIFLLLDEGAETLVSESVASISAEAYRIFQPAGLMNREALACLEKPRTVRNLS